MLVFHLSIHNKDMSEKIYKLSPSDFAFLYRECKRCYCLKVKEGKYRPFQPMPSIFNVIDGAMKRAFEGTYTDGTPKVYEDRLLLSEIDEDLPKARVFESNLRVQSEVAQFSDLGVGIYVAGEIDTLMIYPDEDNCYGVGDGKTSAIKPEYVDMYSRQLHGYAWALSKPAPGRPKRGPVKHLGLLVYEPDLGFFPTGDGQANLMGHLSWMEVPVDSKAFGAFLKEVAALLATDELPPAGKSCSYCRFLKANGVDIPFED
jgi:hypothetical protein